MAYTKTWNEATPSGSTNRGYEVDDFMRDMKVAIRERMEGDDTLTGWCSTFSSSAKPKAGMARIFYDTEANKATIDLEDGRLFASTDEGRLYHQWTAGQAEIPYAHPEDTEDITGVWTFTSESASGPAAGYTLAIYTNDGAAMGSADRLGIILFGGAEDASDTLYEASGIAAFTSQAWSDTAHGSDLRFYVTLDDGVSRSEAGRFNQDRSFSWGGGSGIPDSDDVARTDIAETFTANVDVQAELRCNSLRIDQTPTEDSGRPWTDYDDNYITISFDGSTRRIPCSVDVP